MRMEIKVSDKRKIFLPKIRDENAKIIRDIALDPKIKSRKRHKVNKKIRI